MYQSVKNENYATESDSEEKKILMVESATYGIHTGKKEAGTLRISEYLSMVYVLLSFQHKNMRRTLSAHNALC